MCAAHSKSGKHTDHLWWDGNIILWEDAWTHVMSHTLHYGSGCFEGIKCYETDDGPAVFRLDDHIKRLFASAALYKTTIPFTEDEVVQACINVIKKNRLRSAYVRPVVYYGFDTLGVHPNKCPVHVAVACFNWGAYLGEDGLNNGVRVTMSSWRKFHHSSMPSTAKANGQYLNSMLAVQEAKEKGFDEALLLNMEGNIAEGSGQNLFIVKDGTLITNDQDSSILMGITRDTIIKMAKDQGIPVKIDNMTVEDLLGADEAFFTGTASEVTPIRELDGELIGAGKPGEMTVKFRSQYFDLVHGKLAQYSDWLHYVK